MEYNNLLIAAITAFIGNKEHTMEYNLLMAAITAFIGNMGDWYTKLQGWLKTAAEIREAEESGGPVSDELRAKARADRMAALELMRASKGPGVK